MADFRRWILAFAALVLVLGLVAPASAQSHDLVCSASASVTPTLRHEGFTELTGDILLTCDTAAGSTPWPAGSYIPQANITVSLSAPVTSRILSGTANDALLLVDDPAPPLVGSGGNQNPCLSPTNPTIACRVPTDGGQTFNQPGKFNIYEGIAGGPGSYSVTFLGVPVDPPATGSRTYRITNIRVDATAVPAGAAGLSPVFAFVSSSSSTSLKINNPQNYVGFVSNGLTVATAPDNPPFLQCIDDDRRVGTVTFTENFASAFKIRTNLVQDIPGQLYNSESGLEVTINGHGAGAADTGTRLQTTISNIPSGVTIWVDNWALSPASVNCVWDDTVSCDLLSDATLATAGTTPVDPLANTITAVTDGTQSSVTVVWEVTHTNPSSIDSLAFKIYASYTGAPGVPGSPPVNLATGALSGFSPQLASYSSSGPIPEFSSTVNIPTTPTTLFTISLCQTILLFPYVTDFYGFDTGIAISNTSLDTGSLPAGLGASNQPGACSVTFYGGGGIATTLGTSGVYSSTEDASLTNGLINPGQTWAFSLSGIDPGYNSVAGYGTTGYAIAVCNFQYAHGYSFVSDTGIRNFAAAYLALIIPDATRSPQPSVCSSISSCIGQTGEQLVH